MTRLAVLADLHGNLPALEAICEDLRQFSVDHVILAGDVVNWGPFSDQVMERVASEGWAAIRGNNELYVVDFGTPRAPAIWTTYTLLPWLLHQLSGRWQTLIGAWPDSLTLRYPDGPPVRVLHGSPRSAWDGIYESTLEHEVNVMLAGVDERIVISAHTHLAIDRTVGKWRILNPGSAGNPLDGIRDAQYLLLESDGVSWHPTFRRVPYDLTPVLAEFERQRFVEECGVVGHLAIEEFKTARIHVAPFLAWRAVCYPQEPLTMRLLDRFTEADRLKYMAKPYRLAAGE